MMTGRFSNVCLRIVVARWLFCRARERRQRVGTRSGKYKYDDSYAHLSGFPADQEAWGEVRIAKPESGCNQEVEILLRWTDAPHSAAGYECMARCLTSEKSYLEIVRWEGPLGKFTYLTQKRGAEFGLKDGDVLKASIVGNVITVYVNGVEKARATDDTHKTGNPGIGMYLECAKKDGVGTNANCGFKNFTARAIGQGDTTEAQPEATPAKP